MLKQIVIATFHRWVCWHRWARGILGSIPLCKSNKGLAYHTRSRICPVDTVPITKKNTSIPPLSHAGTPMPFKFANCNLFKCGPRKKSRIAGISDKKKFQPETLATEFRHFNSDNSFQNLNCRPNNYCEEDSLFVCQDCITRAKMGLVYSVHLPGPLQYRRLDLGNR